MVFQNYWQVVNEDSRVGVIYLAVDLWPNIPKSVGLLLLVYDNSPLFDLTYIHMYNQFCLYGVSQYVSNKIKEITLAKGMITIVFSFAMQVLIAVQV